MIDSYLTVTAKSESLYKEKGSKFIGICLPVNSEDEVKERLEEIRKQYYDARHHCYAYILGNEGEVFRANDDGEPNHSAGDPILGQIKSKGLTRTLIVVVRYFGGTKLGVSGLIHAYRTAAQEAIETNSIKSFPITKKVDFDFPYEEMNEVMKLVGEFGISIKNQGYESQSILNTEVLISKVEALTKRVELLNAMGHSINLIM